MTRTFRPARRANAAWSESDRRVLAALWADNALDDLASLLGHSIQGLKNQACRQGLGRRHSRGGGSGRDPDAGRASRGLLDGSGAPSVGAKRPSAANQADLERAPREDKHGKVREAEPEPAGSLGPTGAFVSSPEARRSVRPVIGRTTGGLLPYTAEIGGVGGAAAERGRKMTLA